MSAARTLRAGRCTTSRDRLRTRIGFTRRNAAAGSGKSFSGPMTAAKLGHSQARRRAKRTLSQRDRPKARATSLSTTPPPKPGNRSPALFRSTDGGKNWHELSGLRGHGTGPGWQPGAGGLCLHTIILDPKDPGRIYIAISAAGAFRTDDAGKTWRPINKGLHSQYIPDPNAEVGHCVHHVAMHPSRPNVLFMQKHWDVMRSDNAGDSWQEVSGNLPTDFGFVIDVHAHDPETIYVVPIKSDGEHFPPDGKLRVYRSKTGGNEWEALTKGLRRHGRRLAR